MLRRNDKTESIDVEVLCQDFTYSLTSTSRGVKGEQNFPTYNDRTLEEEFNQRKTDSFQLGLYQVRFVIVGREVRKLWQRRQEVRGRVRVDGQTGVLRQTVSSRVIVVLRR